MLASSAVCVFSVLLQIFGIVLTLITRGMVVSLPHGNLAGNLTISAVLLLGIVGTSEFQAHVVIFF
jgi:hypothetical protein